MYLFVSHVDVTPKILLQSTGKIVFFFMFIIEIISFVLGELILLFPMCVCVCVCVGIAYLSREKVGKIFKLIFIKMSFSLDERH